MSPFVSFHFSWMFKLFFTTFTIKEFFTNLNSFMFLYFHWLYEIYCYNMHKQSVFYQCESLLYILTCPDWLNFLVTKFSNKAKGFSAVWALLCLSIALKCLIFFSQHSQVKNFSHIWILSYFQWLYEIYCHNIHKQSVFYQCESLLCFFTCPDWLYLFVTKFTSKGFFSSMSPLVPFYFS